MDYDVIIAGGGPVGLMLACELRLQGVGVAVLERRTDIDPTIKAGSINLPTMEAFHRRGLLPAVEQAQQQTLAAMKAMPDGPRPVGHFAGLFMFSDKLDESALAVDGPAAGLGLVSQQQVELILAGRAAELGVEIRRGVEVTGIDVDDEGVTVHAGDLLLRTTWLVGCDGGRSRVRGWAGFDFPGTGPEITGHQAMAEIEGEELLGRGWHTTPYGTYAHGPAKGRILTVEFDGPPLDRDAPITREELEASLRRVTGADVRIGEVKTATRFTDNARQASSYRRGRVLLAGDAAHVHSPFGGQGLNLGIGDAMNLGWKLAAEIQGWAPAGLLDSYTTERHPIGAWVLDWTRAQVALMRTDPKSRALRSIVADLLDTNAGTTYMAKKISGYWQGYGDDPVVGRSAPDLLLADGSRVGDHLHDGKGLLLGTAAELDSDRVITLSGDCQPLLIRPDGIVAWAGGDGLHAALQTWFGAAAVPQYAA
ncbi:FAD-dependent oxidoreductase [Microlunatus elymi]|uniref:FAD-dependent oxidoreductase n=1 Tax=Microlunatus elymi TaxID=2596828 RepID=A0A516PU48_9ACTN|nr:FAD-dependent monooxygenase [Microlunatus elymi]QDP94725.1 FAD-dependent oxidoreductase [Microlunatus elymi]